MKPNITLSTGRVVYHRPYKNGATEAYLLNDETMTDDEWQEYCQKLFNLNRIKSLNLNLHKVTA